MKAILKFFAVAVLTGSAAAGPYAPINPMPPSGGFTSEQLFGPGWHLGGHALYLMPDNNLDNSWGGGINADYFINPYIGFQFSGAWADPGTSKLWHNYMADFVVRAPIETAFLAPYAFAGGGLFLENDASVLGRAGVGLEFRPSANFGIFTDWSYSFPGGDAKDLVENYQMIRAGLKFGF